jgi:hypothetical protein
MHWLLTEGGSSLAEQTLIEGYHALMLAACASRFPAMQYLLEEQGASLTETKKHGGTVWSNMRVQGKKNAAELLSLLKVMVMLDGAPADFIARLSPKHAEICTQGRQFRAQLPSYLVQQRAAVVAHCPLPAVLQSLVTAYAVTTPEDMWTDGLRVHALEAKAKRSKKSGEARVTMHLCLVDPFACARNIHS